MHSISNRKYCSQDCKKNRNKTRALKKYHSKSNRSKGILPAAEANFKRDEAGAPTEKICTMCRVWLPVSSFTRRNDTASSCRPFCKKCEASYSKKYYKPKPPKSFECLDCGSSGIKSAPRQTRCKECADIFEKVWKKTYSCSDAGKLRARNQSAKAIAELKPSYIATRLDVPVRLLHENPELLEAKREQIQILRTLKPRTINKKQNAPKS